MKQVEAEAFRKAVKQPDPPPGIPPVTVPPVTPFPTLLTDEQKKEADRLRIIQQRFLPQELRTPIQADPDAPLGGIPDISKMPVKTFPEAMEALGRGALFPIDLAMVPLDALSQTVAELVQLQKPTLFTEGFVASVEKFRDRPLKQQILIGLVTDPLIMLSVFKAISIAGRVGLRGSAKAAAVNELRREMAQGAGRNAPSDVMDEAALFMIEQAQRGALRGTEGSLVWEALEALRIPQAAKWQVPGP